MTLDLQKKMLHNSQPLHCYVATLGNSFRRGVALMIHLQYTVMNKCVHLFYYCALNKTVQFHNLLPKLTDMRVVSKVLSLT